MKRKSETKTIKIKINYATYDFFKSHLKRRKEQAESLGISTVGELITHFIDSTCENPDDISVELEEMGTHYLPFMDYFGYIWNKRMIRRQKAEKGDQADIEVEQEDVKKFENEYGKKYINPYNDGWLRYFQGWINALDWLR